MNPSRPWFRAGLAGYLLTLVFGACGDLKPNTPGEMLGETSAGEGGSGEPAVPEAGTELGTDAGTVDGLPARTPPGGASGSDSRPTSPPGSAGGRSERDETVGSSSAGTPAMAGAAGMQNGSGAAPEAGGTTGELASGGAGSDTGSDTAADSGTDTSAAATSFTVRGRVLDAWGFPLASVPLTLGAQEFVTDSAGEFTASGVQAPYDVAFIVREAIDRGNTLVTDGWSFAGLARPDPTFRVSRGGTLSVGVAVFAVSGTGTPIPSIALGVGLPGGRAQANIPVNGSDLPLQWIGAAQTEGVAHALSFATDPDSGLPSEYQGYCSLPIAVDGTRTVGQQYTLALAPPSSPLAAHAVTGEVGGTFGARVNQVWLGFSDHTALLLAEEIPKSSAFSYLIPQLPGATVTIFASSRSTGGPYALCHRTYDATVAPDTPQAITLPNPPTLIGPWADEALTPDTVFRWQTDNAVSVLTLLQDSSTGLHRIHVVTAEKSARLPERLSRSLLEAGAPTGWIVEAHGRATSLDAVTSAAGFVDPFAGDESGPLEGDGSYAASSIQTLVVPASP